MGIEYGKVLNLEENSWNILFLKNYFSWEFQRLRERDREGEILTSTASVPQMAVTAVAELIQKPGAKNPLGV